MAIPRDDDAIVVSKRVNLEVGGSAEPEALELFGERRKVAASLHAYRQPMYRQADPSVGSPLRTRCAESGYRESFMPVAGLA